MYTYNITYINFIIQTYIQNFNKQESCLVDIDDDAVTHLNHEFSAIV